MSVDYSGGWQALFANFLKIEEIKKNFLFFADIFPKPTDRTMDIVEKKNRASLAHISLWPLAGQYWPSQVFLNQYLDPSLAS